MRLGRIDDVRCWMILGCWKCTCLSRMSTAHTQLLFLVFILTLWRLCKAIQVLGGTLPNCWQRMTQLRTFYCFVAAWHYWKWWDLWNWLAETAACCSWVVVMWLFQCCFMAAAVSREEPRYIQATYTELHCSDTSNCRDSAEVALSQVEDSRQFSQFSWKGVLFFFGRSDGTSPQSASGFLVCDLWRVLSVCGGCPCSMVERRDFGKWNWVAFKTWNTFFFVFLI